MEVSSNELAIQRTKLANERTFLAYMRTGFAIAGIAGNFKLWYITIFGIFMIIISLVKYVFINQHLNKKEDPSNYYLDSIPVLYTVLSLLVLYLQATK
tara:strand:+ start:388 stop:681 length:294 start_codon:yes stop_codon:yes gene_type:complete